MLLSINISVTTGMKNPRNVSSDVITVVVHMLHVNPHSPPKWIHFKGLNQSSIIISCFLFY